MKVKNILLITALLLIFVVGLGFFYGSVCIEDDSEISVLSYREPELLNESGYQIKKYEGINIKEWLYDNKVLIYKENDKENWVESGIISIYDLETKEDSDYGDLNIQLLHDVSPSGKYVILSESKNVNKTYNENDNCNGLPEENCYRKKDILDVVNGQVLYDFDKIPNTYESEYKFINDDYVFVNNLSSWKIINKKGDIKVEGKFNYNRSVKLLDVKEIQFDGNNFSGEFYYTKDFMGEDSGIGIYSMNISTGAEKLIKKYEHSQTAVKSNNLIAVDFFKNNGSSINGVFLNRTFGFEILDKYGNLIRSYELPAGKNYEGLSLSSDGKRCAFVEIDKGKPINAALEVLNIDTGEIQEIINVDNIINRERENLEIDYSKHKNIKKEIRIMNLSNLIWDKTGKSLMFNYEYKSKDDERNHVSSYIVNFDN